MKIHETLPPKRKKRKKINIKEGIKVLEEVGKIMRQYSEEEVKEFIELDKEETEKLRKKGVLPPETSQAEKDELKAVMVSEAPGIGRLVIYSKGDELIVELTKAKEKLNNPNLKVVVK